MGSEIFNDARGRWRTYFDNVIAGSPANCELFVALYKVIEADGTLKTRTSKTNIDAQAGNTECDFDNYALQTLSSVAQGVTSDEAYGDSANSVIVDAGSAGAGTNNDIVKAILFYWDDNTGSSGDAIPLACYDYILTTTGVDLDFTVPSTGLIRE